MNFEQFLNRIHLGNAEKILRNFGEGTIDLVITSPPFFAEGIYMVNGEPEFNWSNYNEYINHLTQVIKQLYRVVKPSAKVCLILGNTPIIGKNQINGLYPITYDVYQSATQCGFNLFSEVIWSKARSSYNDTSIHNIIPHSQPHFNHDIIQVFEKPGKRKNGNGSVTFPSVWDLPNAGEIEDYNEIYNSFPKELVSRCLKMWSTPGDIILDPYAGSGQVVRVSMQFDRNAIGIEIDEDWTYLWKDINDDKG